MKRGLHKIADMGEYWENLTGLPIPLGAIVIKQKYPGRYSTEGQQDNEKKS